MREKYAKWIVFFTGLVVLLLSIMFAIVQNPTKRTDAIISTATETNKSFSLDQERIERGRLIYQQQACANCHSIAGQGNPRIPLDDIGTKRDIETLRDWITGADSLQGSFPKSVMNLKQGYRKLPDDDLNALIIYMQSLNQE